MSPFFVPCSIFTGVCGGAFADVCLFLDAPDPKKLAMEALARLGLLAPTPIAVPLGPAPTAHVPPPEPMDERSTEKMGINHMAGPKRYRLTKKATHDEVGQKFGVSVTVKGVFQAPEAPADPNNEPLHLEITGPSLTAVNAALHYLRDIAAEEEQASACVGKVYIGVPGSAPFNVVAKIVGSGGENLKHIKRTCNVQVTICGRDCRNAENESDEELHMKIEAKSSESLARATQLCEDLLAHVKDMYNEWLKTRPPPPPPPVVRAPPVIQPPVYAPQVLTPEQQQYMLYQQMYLQQVGVLVELFFFFFFPSHANLFCFYRCPTWPILHNINLIQ